MSDFVARCVNGRWLPVALLLSALPAPAIAAGADAKPSLDGRMEALIDGLVDCTPPVPGSDVWHRDEHFRRIVLAGFDAVPNLIAHLQDDRPIRQMTGMRVHDLARIVLANLAGSQARDGWYAPDGDQALKKAEVEKWWASAQKIGEEKYLVDHILSLRFGPIIEENQLAIVAVKYPGRIPELYRSVLDKYPAFRTQPICTAMSHCQLPKKDKLDVLLYAVGQKDKDRSLRALGALKDVDKERFNSLLLAALEACPRELSGSCIEAYAATLVLDSGDPAVWRKLEEVARRSTPGMRMQLLQYLSRPRDTRHRTERLRLYAAFLDDDTWDDGSGGTCAPPFQRDLSDIRDFVALQIALLLDVPIEPRPGRIEELQELRACVREALKRLEIDSNPRSSGKAGTR
jgi:hypothetical protein